MKTLNEIYHITARALLTIEQYNDARNRKLISISPGLRSKRCERLPYNAIYHRSEDGRVG